MCGETASNISGEHDLTWSDAGSVLVISSISMRTRSCAARTTRRGCCLPTFTTTRIVLLKLKITLGFFPLTNLLTNLLTKLLTRLHKDPLTLPRPRLPQAQPTVILPTARPPPEPAWPACPSPSVAISTLYLPSPLLSLSVKERLSPSDNIKYSSYNLQRNLGWDHNWFINNWLFRAHTIEINFTF